MDKFGASWFDPSPIVFQFETYIKSIFQNEPKIKFYLWFIGGRYGLFIFFNNFVEK